MNMLALEKVFDEPKDKIEALLEFRLKIIHSFADIRPNTQHFPQVTQHKINTKQAEKKIVSI